MLDCEEDNYKYCTKGKYIYTTDKIDVLDKSDVLDKIKADIEKLDYLTIEDGSDGYDHYVDKYDVLKIVDKYKAESEG